MIYGNNPSLCHSHHNSVSLTIIKETSNPTKERFDTMVEKEFELYEIVTQNDSSLFYNFQIINTKMFMEL